MKKKLIKIANQIATYNQRAETGDVSAQQKIEELISELDPQELVEIDEYIQSKNLLTKWKYFVIIVI